MIKGLAFNGVDVHTKGKILKREGVEVFCILISLTEGVEPALSTLCNSLIFE